MHLSLAAGLNICARLKPTLLSISCLLLLQPFLLNLLVAKLGLGRKRADYLIFVPITNSELEQVPIDVNFLLLGLDLWQLCFREEIRFACEAVFGQLIEYEVRSC